MKNLILRLIIVIGVLLTINYKIPESFYDIVVALLLLLGLIISYKEARISNIYNVLSNYLFWIVISYIILKDRKEIIFSFNNVFVLLLLIKVVLLAITYFKYKKLEMPSTILSKIWMFTLFLYLTELILNSTHGTKYLFFYTGLISSVELLIILLKTKEWKSKINSVINVFK